MRKNKEYVRDGYLGDLPEYIQKYVMNIHKMIKGTVNSLLDDNNYNDLKDSRWAMSCIEDFCVMPKDNDEIGSVRVYKKGKTYSCMIQVTGHFRNHQYGWIEELLHDFIKNVYATIRPKIRKDYDITINNEGDRGSCHEGFDIFLSKKDAQEIWELLDDRKTKAITEDGFEVDLETGEIGFERGYVISISNDLINFYENNNNMTFDQYMLERSHRKLKYDFRDVFDYDTGHALMIVYSLDNIKITGVGGHYLNDSKYVPNDLNIKNENDLKEYIQKNIKTKGSMDHQSTDQKVLAIVDRTNQKRLTQAKTIGPYAPGVKEFNMKTNFYELSIPKDILKQIHDNYNKKGKDFISDNVFILKVGEIDNSKSFKSTKWFKNNMIGIEKNGKYVAGNNMNRMRTTSERIQFSRGAKADDIDPDYPALFEPEAEYFHPSKRDIKRFAKKEEIKLKNKRREEQLNRLKKESFNESIDNKESYNTDMTESQAKKTLNTLSQTIINNGDKKITQYTANIYANIITKNLLPRWSKGYRKFSISLDSYQSFPTLEFKIPSISQDFISRFINGKETIGGFLHRIPEIKIKMSPRIFHTMTDADDAYNFFKSAIKYYDSKVEKYCKSLMMETMKMNHNMKHLVSTTKLSGIVTYPLKLLFIFDDVKMNDKQIFELSEDDIKAVNQFIKNIYTKYSAPEKEKKKIIDDVKELVKELRESGDMDDNMRSLYYLPEAVESYLYGKYDNIIYESDIKFIQEQIDLYDMKNNKDPNVKYLREAFGVKRLKKIPTDLVAYISIETESIKTSNDKMMIASYCLGKIEIVEWYIELIETGSRKYVVPHTKPYLELVKTQLLACFKKIMDTKINTSQRPIIDIQYPSGYEG